VLGGGGGGVVVVVVGACVGWNLVLPPVLNTDPNPGRLAAPNLEPVDCGLGGDVEGSSVVVVSGRLGNVVLLRSFSVSTWIRDGR
jgi:hypothetical protein